MKERIGFIGLGTMGKPMSLNVIKAGYPVVVFDINPEPVKELKTKGAAVATSAKEVASLSDVIITMLPKSEHVEAAVLGAGGVIEGAKSGSVVIDMSTIDPSVSRKTCQALAAKGVEMLDAPVTGGDTGAIAGTLTIMSGGKQEVYDRCLPVLQAMGKNIFYCGPIGNGEIVKIVNNFLGGAQAFATAEALSLGVRAGVDFKTLFDVISVGTGANGFMTRLCPIKAFKGNYEPGFMAELMHKDLGLAVTLGKETNTPLLMGALIFEMFSCVTALGFGKQDFSVVVKVFEDLNKIKMRLE